MIRLQQGGVRWACANIGYPSHTLNAVAKFDYPISGQIIMRQEADDPYGDTSVLVNLQHAPHVRFAGGQFQASNVLLGTSAHRWTIRQRPVPQFDRCAAGGSLHNPFFIDPKHPAYTHQCSARAAQRCQMGDLSAKLGLIDIASPTDFPAKRFFTDTQLPIGGGAVGVIGRSLVIHEAGGGRALFACANITQF